MYFWAGLVTCRQNTNKTGGLNRRLGDRCFSDLPLSAMDRRCIESGRKTDRSSQIWTLHLSALPVAPTMLSECRSRQLSNAGGPQILQIHETLRRRDRYRDDARFGHQREYLIDCFDTQFTPLRQNILLGLHVRGEN